MALSFLQDDKLKVDCVIISQTAAPLEDYYHECNRQQRGGQQELLRWAATRALAVDADNSWLAPEVQALAPLSEFSVCLASNICWAHLMFAYSLPHAAAVLLAECRAARQAGMDRADSLACGNADLETIFVDLGWTDQALPQEVLAACVQSDFDCDFMPLRQLMIKCYSGSNTTREVCESCFATLQDKVFRQSKNKKACGTTLWFYSLTSKYAHEEVSGMRHMPLGREQWAAARALYGDGKSKEFQNYANAFALNSTKLPQGDGLPFPRTRKGLQKTTWRNSGPLSHYHSSAAAAYMMHDSPNDFKNAGNVWAGLG
ncbi:unnamed protein product, partial [Effrenium voratum]